MSPLFTGEETFGKHLEVKKKFFLPPNMQSSSKYHEFLKEHTVLFPEGMWNRALQEISYFQIPKGNKLYVPDDTHDIKFVISIFIGKLLYHQSLF